ncbi:MAG: YidH family protein [Gammaproteobacteria bacterium]
MSDSIAASSPDRFAVKASAESHFSWVRTRLSVERTLMSWVRTSISLIGFGFTIVQFFERLSSMEGVEHALRPLAPRYIGLSLIACGVLALVVSIWQYQSMLGYLFSRDFKPVAGVEDRRHKTPLLAVAVVLTLIGLSAFFAVLFRAV